MSDTTTALIWLRKSSGEEEAVGFDKRKELVRTKADEIADETVELNLGVHTGFSIHTRDPDEPRIDNNPEVQEMLDRIEDGEFDYIVAYDDKRVARDEFFSTIELKAKLGEAPFVFLDDVARDNMTFELKRVVERNQKQKEIEQAKEAIKEKLNRDEAFGRPPFGYQYSADKSEFVIDEGEVYRAAQAFRMRDDGAILEDIEDETDIPTSTLSDLFNDRRDEFEDLIRIVTGDGDAGVAVADD